MVRFALTVFFLRSVDRPSEERLLCQLLILGWLVCLLFSSERGRGNKRRASPSQHHSEISFMFYFLAWLGKV
ncbi:hypothetical protein THTE_3108 [Thermogutta terrifontis]|uniref:Uncharacterized protein n=1 Tax=Thermogutta terrifontis TaxID=1331910 RepID=A0A286RIC2_9BACT|nr:hypothetical protein THTE_3108 [Thermogutta terrifontis]